MYISCENSFKLDKIIKSFEVAYRSYIIDKIYKEYDSFCLLNSAIVSISNNADKDICPYPPKWKSKIKNMSKPEKIKKLYDAIIYVNDSTTKQDCAEEKLNEVLYLSTVVDLTYFFNMHFSSIINGISFDAFFYENEILCEIRNLLSHPAQAKIKKEVAIRVSNFILLVMGKISKEFFWYVRKEDIDTLIQTLLLNLKQKVFAIDNLNDVFFQNQVIVCRENELDELYKYIIGENKRSRKPGSVVLFGYGGVGKTAIVLEFIENLQKKIMDNEIEHYRPSFMLYFTFKEEVLGLEEIRNVGFETVVDTQQVMPFNDVKTQILSLLNIENIWDVEEEGIIVFDNVETFSVDEREQLSSLMNESPRKIQYILTSRYEEKCEERIPVKDFNNYEDGISFINKYVEANNSEICLKDKHINSILDCSKGNTLIIVLLLRRIEAAVNSNLNGFDTEETINCTITTILAEFASAKSKNIENIMNFMYKNTFERSNEELKILNLKADEILRIIFYYEKPIDISFISNLSNYDRTQVKQICEVLVKRLVLDVNGVYYKINEFARRYIIGRYISNSIDDKRLKNKVIEERNKLQNGLRRFSEKINSDRNIKRIVDEWGTMIESEKVYIAQSYSMFTDARNIAEMQGSLKIISFKDFCKEYEELEDKTEHPYIKFQKARIFKQHFWKDDNKEIRNTSENIISSSYENALFTIEYSYSYIRTTKTYASVLWLYGMFLFERGIDSYLEAADLIEKARRSMESQNLKDAEYRKIIDNLCDVYYQLFLKYNDKGYLIYITELFNLLEKPLYKWENELLNKISRIR